MMSKRPRLTHGSVSSWRNVSARVSGECSDIRKLLRLVDISITVQERLALFTRPIMARAAPLNVLRRAVFLRARGMLPRSIAFDIKSKVTKTFCHAAVDRRELFRFHRTHKFEPTE